MSGLLQNWVTQQARERPDAPAIIAGTEQMTYGQLDELSSRLCNALRSKGCQVGDRVCLMQSKTPRTIVSILATLKAGAIYVPIDMAQPPARIAKILDRCEPQCLLADPPSSTMFQEVLNHSEAARRATIGFVGDQTDPSSNLSDPLFWNDLNQYAPEAPTALTSPGDAAYIFFTSGSTGIPKGVIITHANVYHFVEWGVNYFGIDATDRLSGFTPLYFDLSTFDLYATFMAGAQLHLVSPQYALLPHKLANLIRSSELTQWFSVPSVMTYLASADAVGENDFPSLRRVLWCGEVLPTTTLIHWMKRLPNVMFTNLYGPTETTVASSYFTVQSCPEDDRQEIPIGLACEGEQLLILDDSLNEVPTGEQGDLYIQGNGLGIGYWQDTEKTDEAFIPHPTSSGEKIYRTGDRARNDSDGLVYYIGRNDAQIKSRGFRIELGEIETALNSEPSLAEAAVVAVDSAGFEGQLICCAYVAQGSMNLEPSEIGRQLRLQLPSYMVPAQWEKMDRLPRNPNGKVDRNLLRDLFSQKQKS